MPHYLYRCTACNRELDPEEIQETTLYLCPHCGKAEQKQPLKGVLRVEYDYAELRRSLNREAFLRLPVGQPWLYPQLLPLEFEPVKGVAQLRNISDERLQRLALPSNLLLRTQLDGRPLLVLDDTRNPTFSYKDRASILVALKALQMGIGEIAAASTGNAGSSLAGVCARLGLTARLFAPESIPAAKLMQMQAYGAQVHLVKGDYDAAFDLCLELSRELGLYNRNTAYNPLTVEGKKSAAYDLFIATKGKLPDAVFIPVGDGVILAGVYKGLWELQQLGWIERLPQLYGVQAQGSNALVRYLQTGVFEYYPAQTLADSIGAGAPRNLFWASEAIRATSGDAMAVSDAEILEAQQRAARKLGVLIEPAAAASLAGYLAWRKSVLATEKTALLLFTGNGLKDAKTLMSWLPSLQSKSPEEWKARLKKKD